LLPKGWVHAANSSAKWCSRALANCTATADGVTVLCLGHGLALAAVAAVLDERLPVFSLGITEALQPLQPLLASALRAHSLGTRLSFETAAASPAHDAANGGADGGGGEGGGGEGSGGEGGGGKDGGEGGGLLLWELPPGGLDTPLVESVRAAARLLPPPRRVAPLRVEVWAAPLHCGPGGVAAGRGGVEGGAGARDDLRRLLCCDRELCAGGGQMGFRMDAFAEAMLAAQQHFPIRLEHWAATPLSAPVLVLRWQADAGEAPVCTVAAAEVEAGGDADALVFWHEVEVSPGEWVSGAPPADLLSPPPPLAARARTPASSREPQLACALPPMAVAPGSDIAVACLASSRGLRFLVGPAFRRGAEIPDVSFSRLPGPPTWLEKPLPAWCALMMNDTERAEAYAAALEKALPLLAARRTDRDAPLRILDVGAGAGLLSLLAARAAASCNLPAEIVAVERDGNLVTAAAAAFAAHAPHLPGCVSLRAVESEVLLLRGEEEAAARYDLVVTETFGDDALAEQCVPLLRHVIAGRPRLSFPSSLPSPLSSLPSPLSCRAASLPS